MSDIEKKESVDKKVDSGKAKGNKDVSKIMSDIGGSLLSVGKGVVDLVIVGSDKAQEMLKERKEAAAKAAKTKDKDSKDSTKSEKSKDDKK